MSTFAVSLSIFVEMTSWNYYRRCTVYTEVYCQIAIHCIQYGWQIDSIKYYFDLMIRNQE